MRRTREASRTSTPPAAIQRNLLDKPSLGGGDCDHQRQQEEEQNDLERETQQSHHRGEPGPARAPSQRSGYRLEADAGTPSRWVISF